MTKPSKKRIALLLLIKENADSESGRVYFPSFTANELGKYNLTFWDTSIIAYAEKAGLIETKSNKTFGWLTEAGKQLLKKYDNSGA